MILSALFFCSRSLTKYEDDQHVCGGAFLPFMGVESSIPQQPVYHLKMSSMDLVWKQICCPQRKMDLGRSVAPIFLHLSTPLNPFFSLLVNEF